LLLSLWDEQKSVKLRYLWHNLGETKIAGASAGSLIAAAWHAGLTEQQLREACLVLAHDCRINGTQGRLGKVLKHFLDTLMPEDAHERCKGKAYIAVTKVGLILPGFLEGRFGR
jgi:hypothetical protein